MLQDFLWEIYSGWRFSIDIFYSWYFWITSSSEDFNTYKQELNKYPFASIFHGSRTKLGVNLNFWAELNYGHYYMTYEFFYDE